MIKIEDLSVNFGSVRAVKNINLEIRAGEILGVVGESGSGKSVTALTLMGLVGDSATVASGRILFDETVLMEARTARDKALYRKFQGERMAMIFQEPMTSLNPTQKAGKQVEEALKLHTDMGPDERKALVLETFSSVGLGDPQRVWDSYPHQLSGGMRQRVMIAMAVILHPDLIVADEPTTALDVTVQSQIIQLLQEINEREKNAMLFITHDLNLARRLCHRVAVMKDGRGVEQGNTEEIFESPREEYTKRLMESIPARVKKRYIHFDNAIKSDETGVPAADAGDLPVVEVDHLNVYYQEGSNSLFGRKKRRRVVSDASFALNQGEILGLVGESGCGKSSLSRAILGMNRETDGQVRHYSKRPQMIFQDPYSSLNPAKTIGWLLQEPLRAEAALTKSAAMTAKDMETAAHDMLCRVGLDESYFDRKPAQLSGGQRQRVSIGQALIARPRFVIADEPVSALDVTLQAQIMELMQGLQEELGLSYLFISHDINIVYQMSDRIMVMKDGRIVEQGRTEEVFAHPKDPYTKELLGVLP